MHRVLCSGGPCGRPHPEWLNASCIVNTRELAEEINHSTTVTKVFQRGKHLRLPCALQARHEVRAIWSGQLKWQSQG